MCVVVGVVAGCQVEFLDVVLSVKVAVDQLLCSCCGACV